jgi:hypothetical protein
MSEYDPLGLYQKENTEYDPLGLYGSKEDEEYSSLRSAGVEFVESAIGVGDELDAVVRILSGEAANYTEAIGQARADVEAFKEDNPNAAKALAVSGFVTGFFIPGMGLAKISQAATRGQRAARAAGFGAAEGAVYGFLQGEGEEGRLAGATLGAVGGGVIGGAAGRYLTKGADEIEAARRERQRIEGQATHIGGNDGFVDVGEAPDTSVSGVMKNIDTSLQKRKTGEVLSKDDPDYGKIEIEVEAEGQSGHLGNLFLGTRNWFVKNVGERAARLAEDAETMIRHEQREIDRVFDDEFVDVAKMFEENDGFKTLFTNINKRVGKKKQVTWEKVQQAPLTAAEKQAAKALEDQVKFLQEMDFVKIGGDADYFPTIALQKAGTLTKISKSGKETKVTKGRSEDYANPVEALKQMAQDISAARALAARFDIDLKTIKIPAKTEGVSRVDIVIDAIEQAAKSQGASSAVAKNLAKGLRSQIIASQKGGATVGALARRSISAALLGNPLNALLNIPEGITAPIVQNGVMAYARTIPSMVVPTVTTLLEELSTTPLLGKLVPDFKKDVAGWLNNRQLGIDREFMGELANIGKKAFNESADIFQLFTRGKRSTQISESLAGKVDNLNKLLYKVTGVSTVNRMGQEILANTAIKRGMMLAKSGKAKDLDKLRKHDGMRGLTESEFQSTVKALQAGDLTNPWLINFAGASLNKWQPVSASALPRAFHDNPNGRVMYSMLSYMNRQFNNIRNDIVLKGVEAHKHGLNTKEGAEAAKDAMRNAAYYVGAFGVFAGMWDDGRQTLDLSKDKYMEDLLTPEGITSATMNQLASNITSGIYNMRAPQFGGQEVDLTPAPIAAGQRLASGAAGTVGRLLTGEEQPMAPLLRAGRTYFPGVANVDRIVRMRSGERLFEDYID